MKALNINTMKSTRQSGFTIIELVVVILLLGILTATALPRFLDLSDEAHAAVVDAVRGGMGTGTALFRAGFVAGGQDTDTAIADFGSNFPNSSGYPIGADTSTTIDSNDDCVEIYQGLLQPGRPTIAASASTGGPISGADVTTAGAVDFVTEFTSATTCTYAYIGQFNSVAGDAIPVLDYDASAGTVVEGTAL